MSTWWFNSHKLNIHDVWEVMWLVVGGFGVYVNMSFVVLIIDQTYPGSFEFVVRTNPLCSSNYRIQLPFSYVYRKITFISCLWRHGYNLLAHKLICYRHKAIIFSFMAAEIPYKRINYSPKCGSTNSIVPELHSDSPGALKYWQHR